MPKNLPYWLEESLLMGASDTLPERASVVIIGAGLSGVSAAYWLGKKGLRGIILIDNTPEIAASVRNAGHILYGSVESMARLCVLQGKKKAKEIWQFSVEICHAVRDTIKDLGLRVDYAQNGYLVCALEEAENNELLESIKILNELGFQSTYVTQKKIQSLGFKNVLGGRFEAGGAQAHPVKFRNALLQYAKDHYGLKYFSQKNIKSVEDTSGTVKITGERGTMLCDAAVLATNAYSPLLSDFFRDRQLVEPFRGQIQVSKPLAEKIPVSYPHSFDHGFEYALAVGENRLLIGGWRHATQGKELGLYDLGTNPEIFSGLSRFVERHYPFKEPVLWDYSWSGIMAASKTGFPFIGPTSSPLIFALAGFTGHGFSWAHGSAHLLADIILGNKIPSVATLFNPVIS